METCRDCEQILETIDDEKVCDEIVEENDGFPVLCCTCAGHGCEADFYASN